MSYPWPFYILLGVAVVQIILQQRWLRETRKTVFYQDVWIKAQHRMLKAEQAHVRMLTQSMNAIPPAKVTAKLHPEGWDA